MCRHGALYKSEYSTFTERPDKGKLASATQQDAGVRRAVVESCSDYDGSSWPSRTTTILDGTSAMYRRAMSMDACIRIQPPSCSITMDGSSRPRRMRPLFTLGSTPTSRRQSHASHDLDGAHEAIKFWHTAMMVTHTVMPSRVTMKHSTIGRAVTALPCDPSQYTWHNMAAAHMQVGPEDVRPSHEPMLQAQLQPPLQAQAQQQPCGHIKWSMPLQTMDTVKICASNSCPLPTVLDRAGQADMHPAEFRVWDRPAATHVTVEDV